MNEPLGPAQRKVLWAILAAAQDKRMLTISQIAQRLSLEERYVEQDIKELTDRGLIEIAIRPRARIEFTKEAFGAVHR